MGMKAAGGLARQQLLVERDAADAMLHKTMYSQVAVRAAARRWLEDPDGGPGRFVDAVKRLARVNVAARRGRFKHEVEETATALRWCERVRQACGDGEPEDVVEALVQLTECIERAVGPEPIQLDIDGLGILGPEGSMALTRIQDWLTAFAEFYGPDAAAEAKRLAQEPAGIWLLRAQQSAGVMRFKIEEFMAGRPFGGVAEAGGLDDAMDWFEEAALNLPEETTAPVLLAIRIFESAIEEGNQPAAEAALRAVSVAAARLFGTPWELPFPIRAFTTTEVEEAVRLWPTARL